MESLQLLLGDRAQWFTGDEKRALAARKNERSRELLQARPPSDIVPGVGALLADLRARGVLLAIGSSSRNTHVILERVGLHGFFDAVADGARIAHSKPDPEVFLLAARDLGIPPVECLVVEDADAGVQAARAAGMRVVAVGAASENPAADIGAPSLGDVARSDWARLTH